MSDILEILKYVLPSLVVLATAYFILKKFLDAKYSLAALEYGKDMAETKLPLKLQAYERLMLFCERIDVNNLLFRLYTPEITGEHLSKAMLVSIQKEFEHNLAQQLYVSDSLWQIITQSKDNVLALITTTASQQTGDYTSAVFVDTIQKERQAATTSLEIAKTAIREETRSLLG